MRSNQVHVDLETLDIESTAKVLSIGAVFLEDRFYCEISQGDYPEATFTESKSTRDWWDKQGGFIPTVEALTPEQAIRSFVVWFNLVTEDLDDVQVWANSPSFDCAILAVHCQFYNVRLPWRYYQEQDVRTMKRLADSLKLGIKMSKNDHNALRDAQNQRNFVERITERLVADCELARTTRETDYQLDVSGGQT